MCATAANLIEHVLPEVALRQWGLTFPFAWRKRLAMRRCFGTYVGRRSHKNGWLSRQSFAKVQLGAMMHAVLSRFIEPDPTRPGRR